MKSINYYDASYSRNESFEMEIRPNCMECCDEGFTRHGVFNELKKVCECSDATPCYFCDTPMTEANSQWREDVCTDCCHRELGGF